MLTRNDVTIPDARRVYAEVADLPVPIVGFKDIGLPVAELKALASDIRANGQAVALEVVSQTRADELKSIRAGLDIGVDYIFGGTHADDAVAILNGSGIQYMPFPGRIVGHPSELHGTPEEIIESARALSQMRGVAGLDLLAYRFSGDVETLTARVMKAVDRPVVIAGSIATAERIRFVCRLGAWGFTVGSAIFANKFSSTKGARGQVSAIAAIVENYMANNP
jgi:pyridoxal biosynthesis lyase PdxS